MNIQVFRCSIERRSPKFWQCSEPEYKASCSAVMQPVQTVRLWQSITNSFAGQQLVLLVLNPYFGDTIEMASMSLKLLFIEKSVGHSQG